MGAPFSVVIPSGIQVKLAGMHRMRVALMIYLAYSACIDPIWPELLFFHNLKLEELLDMMCINLKRT